MAENDELKQYFAGEDQNPEPSSVNIETAPIDPYPPNIPSGYEPMGFIKLEGIAYRGLASGGMPWWILIGGWIALGGFAFVGLSSLFTTLFSGSLASLPLALVMLLPAILVISLPLLILWRGTQSKLARRRKRLSR